MGKFASRRADQAAAAVPGLHAAAAAAEHREKILLDEAAGGLIEISDGTDQ
jgi:hypothetical protein